MNLDTKITKKDLLERPFIHLRVHTAYSLLEGALKIKDLAYLLKEYKMPAVAQTDTGNLFGALEFSSVISDSGIQPIIGCQVKIKSEFSKEETGLKIKSSLLKDKAFYDTLILLAQNEQGYLNLLKLVSLSYLEKSPEEPAHISFEDLESLPLGLIVLTGGVDGGVGRHLLKKDVDGARHYLERLQRSFEERLYIEIMRHGLDAEHQTEKGFIDLAYALNIPLVATNNAFFAKRQMYKAHDALLCVAEGVYVDQENRRKVTPEHYLKSSEEMANLFEDLPEAYLNTSIIAQRCSFRPKERAPILPPFPAESNLSEGEILDQMARAGLKKRLSALSSDSEKETAYWERLNYELKIIIHMGYAGYFLIVADFIQWAKSKDIPVGPGRGSGAGSVVAWSLTITDVDPIKLNLIFERFLNPERVSMPDFDIDFCQDRRDEVITYVQNKYGKDRVAQIITFGKLASRAVIRDVGRVLGMPYPQVDKISKLIPYNPTNPITLEEAVAQEPEIQALRQSDPAVAELIEIALDLEGLYRHASTHAAGLVIADRPLNELVPLYRDPRSQMPVTQFNMKYVEQAGLVKFDFLGLKALTIIEDTVKLIRQKNGDFDISRISLDDKKTFDLLNRVETHGIFQVESAGMRDVLGQLRPDRFEELVALVALYRPGPMDDIPRYLACKHGVESVAYAHPMLEEILQETFGVMVYQEQVMQIAQVMAGYTLGAADLLRRAMGKKIKSEMNAQRQLFVKGAVERGIKESLAHDVFDQMAKFAGYGFNKSHSAPYALLLYQTAYLKANYPVAFFTSTLTHDRGNIDKLNDTCLELRRMGVSVLPPDVNASGVYFKMEETENGTSIRYALSAVKNVGDGGQEEVVSEREKNGPYRDIFDFACRNSTKVINKRQLERLICGGVFDSLHPNRRELFENIDLFIKIANESRTMATDTQTSLFGKDDHGKIQKKQDLKPFEEWPSFEKLQKEYDAIGFYLSMHPLENYISSFKEMGVTLTSELKNLSGENESKPLKFVGVITGLQKKIAKSGNFFAFLQLSDPTGLLEVTLFSEVLTCAKDLLESGKIVCVTAFARQDKFGGEGESIRLTAQSIQSFEALWGSHTCEKIIKIESVTSLQKLEKLLMPCKGKGKSVVKLLIPISLPTSLKKNDEKSYAQVFLGDTYAFPPHFSFES